MSKLHAVKTGVVDGDDAGRRSRNDSGGAFLRRYPEYRLTRRLDELRATEYRYLDEGGHTYLDYGGAGLPADSQISAHSVRMRGNCYGNPHSASPASVNATELVERTRARILAFFRASADEYAVVFTPNATGACRLVGEAYAFAEESRFVLTLDNHNSVNGIREFARRGGAATEYVPVRGRDQRIATDDVRAALAGGGKGLFAFPAQSNFTGVQHPMEWIELAREHGYDVLLDAAAYVPANRLDLSVVHPDFVPVSWYKVFGYPTGVGCLVVRREALARLRRPWFSGGTIQVASAQGGWHELADDETAFEDGTLDFLGIPDVATGIEWIEHIGVDLVHRRVMCLTGWLLDRLSALRHSNGRPMAEIYGPHDTTRRGGTVAFNLRDPDGQVIDGRVVERDGGALGISLRTGCFCNPGAGEAALALDEDTLRETVRRRSATLEEYLVRLGVTGGGAVRVSVGLASDFGDVERFLRFAEETYRDRRPSHEGLPPRHRC